MVSLLLKDDPFVHSTQSNHVTENPNYTIFGNASINSEDNSHVEMPEPAKNTETRSDGVSELEMNLSGMYVTDALYFRNVPFRPDKLSLYLVYQDRIVRYTFVLFPALLLGLALMEQPAVLKVHWQAALSLELLCLIVCSGRVLHLRACLHRREFWTDIKNCVVIVSIVIMFVDMVVCFVYKTVEGKDVIRVSRVLRPLLIINFSDNRNLRKLLRNIKRTVLDVISVLVLIFLFIAIFAMMATKFFERRTLIDPHGDRYLDNFYDSYWNLYVLMTTANSPDVSLPAFKDEEAFFIFFMPFSIITTFILMNILLAVVYKHYRVHLLEEVKADIGIIQENLKKAFILLKDPETDHIARDVWKKCYRKLGCPDGLQSLYWDYMAPTEDLPGISLQSFFKITDLLSSRIEIVICKKTWLEFKLPIIYNSAPSCYLRYVVSHFAFTLFYDALILINAVVLSLKSSPPVLEDIFLALFNIEIILKVYTYGPRKFASTAWNCYDCLVIWAATIFSLVVDVEGMHDSKDEELSNVFLDMVLTLRVLRLLKLLTSVPQLRLIVNTLMQIVPSMGSYALLLFLFYYSYAIAGMELFAGKILSNETLENCGNDALNGTEFLAEGYCTLTFNNILYSFVVLWTLTLVNQWHILAGGFVAVTNKWSRLYFLSFHVLIVLITLNIFLAFVIEAFMLQIELDKKKLAGIDEHLDEKGVNARRESRPQNQPVWYKKPSLTRSTEEDDLKKIYIGTTPLDEKVRYKKQKSTKSYNQLLLDMFQEDIQTGETSSTSGSEGDALRQVSVQSNTSKTSTSSAKPRLVSVREDDIDLVEVDEGVPGGKYSGQVDKLSYGSLEDLDII